MVGSAVAEIWRTSHMRARRAPRAATTASMARSVRGPRFENGPRLLFVTMFWPTRIERTLREEPPHQNSSPFSTSAISNGDNVACVFRGVPRNCCFG